MNYINYKINYEVLSCLDVYFLVYLFGYCIIIIVLCIGNV